MLAIWLVQSNEIGSFGCGDWSITADVGGAKASGMVTCRIIAGLHRANRASSLPPQLTHIKVILPFNSYTFPK